MWLLDIKNLTPNRESDKCHETSSSNWALLW